MSLASVADKIVWLALPDRVMVESVYVSAVLVVTAALALATRVTILLVVDDESTAAPSRTDPLTRVLGALAVRVTRALLVTLPLAATVTVKLSAAMAVTVEPRNVDPTITVAGAEPVMAVLLAVVLYIGSRTIVKDLQKRETAAAHQAVAGA